MELMRSCKDADIEISTNNEQGFVKVLVDVRAAAWSQRPEVRKEAST
jgi:hypothetical protein